MKKRIISILLTAALLLALVPFGATEAKAASEFTVSEACVEMIKELEGFSSKPYWDYSQWTVGYGTRAPDEHLARYKSEGISREEAQQLLDEFLTNMGRSINSFIDKFGLTMTQNQFDALLSFTFNCGSSWLYQSSLFRTAVIEGETGNDFLFKMGQWSNAGGSIQKGLVRRRLVEANMYLNGIYNMTVPENYCYVLYNANGGSTDIRVQAYDSNLTSAPIAAATYEGYTFAGWYTDPAGGEAVTVLDANVRNYTLYAHWTAGDGEDLPQDSTDEEITGTSVDYSREIVPAVLNAFDKPVKGALVVNAYKQGAILDIIAEYTDANNVKWGKVSNGGWINLAQTQEPVVDNLGSGVQVEVTTNDVNVRQGPGTDYKSIGKAQEGDKMVITQTATGSGYTWGKFSGGWICLKYTTYDVVTNGDNKPETTTSVMGTVKVSSGLRVRSGAGTSYEVKDFLTDGTRVEILEQKTVDGTVWGRISKGWISMEYVVLDQTSTEPPATEPPATEPPATEPPTTEPPATEPPATEPPATEPPATEPPVTEPPATEPPATEPPATEPPATEPPATEPPATEPPATEPPATEPPVTEPPATEPPATEPPATEPPATKKVMGTITGNKLRIRSGPSTGYSVLGYLNKGDRVEVLEQKTVGSSTWAKIPEGWVSMSYVKLDEATSTEKPGTNDTPTTPTTPNTPSTPSTPGALTGVISGTSKLSVRSGPGTNYTVTAYLSKGTKVEITEQKQGGSIMWGKTAKGWVSMNYVKLDSNSGTSSGSQSGNTGSTGNAVSGTIKVSNFLNIRGGAGTNYSIVGKLYNGDKVEIYETKAANGSTWGRIDKGWISMKYVVTGGTSTGNTSSGNASDGTSSGNTSSGNTSSGSTGIKTGTATMSLCIRSGAGTGNKVVGYLSEGSTVTVLETKVVSGITWGRIEKGWISLKYVK